MGCKSKAKKKAVNFEKSVIRNELSLWLEKEIIYAIVPPVAMLRQQHVLFIAF